MTTRLSTAFRGQKLIYLCDLLRELIARDLKVRYKDSSLGIAWSFINPFLHLLIFYFLFKLVLSLNIRRYSSFAFSGMLAWTWFQASISQAAGVIKYSRELVRQPGFPVPILPVVSVSSNLIHFLIALPILALVLILGETELNPTILLLPLVITVQLAMTLGLAYLVAAGNALFRDMQHILDVFLRLYFFLTPIFYDASIIPERFRLIYYLNPLTHLVEAYRAILLHGASPEWLPMAALGLLAVVLLYLGFRAFQRTSYRFAEEI